MLTINIRWNLEDVVRRLRLIRAEIGPALAQAMADSRNLVIRRALTTKLTGQVIRRRTGNLIRTVQQGGFSRQTGPLSAIAVIGSSAEYAPGLEFGTGPHTIFPVRAKALSWISSGGERLFASRVNHPGNPPKPFLGPSVEESANDIRRVIVRRLSSVLRATPGGAS